MPKVSFQYCFTAPWRECEMCYFGPAWLNQGDHSLALFSLFFIEVGIRIEWGSHAD